MRATDEMLLKVSQLTACPARFRLDRFTLLAAAIGGLGTALILGREFAFGVGLTVDSAQYIAGTRNLLAGEGLIRLNGNLFTFWPPLYPLLLAAASLGIFDPIVVAGPLNAIIFGLTVFIVGGYLRQCLESRFLAIWGCLATALAIPLLKVSSFALSDTLFILLATLALIWTDRFLTEGKVRTLVWAAVFSALAWQTRYIGVAVPACVGLLLLFHPSTGTSLAQRVRRLTAYLLIVAVPMALWFLRNYLATGEFTEHSSPTDYPVSMMLRDVVEILWRWGAIPGCRFLGLPYWHLFDRAVLVLQAITAALLVPVGCMLIAEQWKRRTVARWHPLWLFGGFALIYLVLFIAVISLLVRIYMVNGIAPRFLIPLYIPLLIAGVFVLDRILGYDGRGGFWETSVALPSVRTMMPARKGSVLVTIVTIVLSLGVARLIVPAVSTIMVPKCHHQSLGYNTIHWVGSDVLRYVRKTSVAGEIYSNAPDPLFLYDGGKSTNRYHALCNSCTRTALERQFAERIPDGAYVIWFDGWELHLFDYGEDDLRLLPGLKLVADLADGVVFKVTK